MKMNSFNILLINSAWPILVALNSMLFTMNIILLTLKMINYWIILLNLFLLIINVNNWIFSIIMENTLIGLQSLINQLCSKMLITLIIMSELMFFMSFFYTNFTSSKFLNSFFNFKIQTVINLNFLLSFLNLTILLTSSLTFMIFLNLLNLNSSKALKFINLTIILGIYFVSIQFAEYKILGVNISSSIYYSNFFLLTFFHMNHVIMGIFIISVMTFYHLKYLHSLSNKFMLVCWYWHFIDLIWLLIFIFIY